MGLMEREIHRSRSASSMSIPRRVVGFEPGVRGCNEITHATQMQQHIGEQGGTTGSVGESKTPPLLGKRRFCRAVDSGLVGLITRRSQVQILPPPPKKHLFRRGLASARPLLRWWPSTGYLPGAPAPF